MRTFPIKEHFYKVIKILAVRWLSKKLMHTTVMKVKLEPLKLTKQFGHSG